MNTHTNKHQPSPSTTKQSLISHNETSNLYTCLEQTVFDQTLNHYTARMLNNHSALRFLESRGINVLDAIYTFRLGFADRTLGLRFQHLNSQDRDRYRGTLQRMGLIKPTGHELFTGALVFPFLDENNVCNGAYGRRICPKLNSRSAYDVHWNLKPGILFNQQALLLFPSIILCKNPIDALSWWSNGFTNSISIMSTEEFRVSQLNILSQSNIESVYIAFGCSSGELKAARAIAGHLMKAKIKPLRIVYPDGLDANGLIQRSANPASALQECLEDALLFTNHNN